jgi:hypothetical protein
VERGAVRGRWTVLKTAPGAGCVATGVQANHMRATSIERIEADCRAECGAAAP